MTFLASSKCLDDRMKIRSVAIPEDLWLQTHRLWDKDSSPVMISYFNEVA